MVSVFVAMPPEIDGNMFHRDFRQSKFGNSRLTRQFMMHSNAYNALIDV